MTAAALRLSVIVPTYNRTDLLPRCLRALEGQTIPRDSFEIVVVDDGSTDATPQVVEGLSQELEVPVHYIRQENKGPAGARNTGIRHARGRVIWITGDDYIAEPDCLEHHLHWHETVHPEEEAVVLGYATWHPELEVTDLMHWVENGGLQFFYPQIRHGDEIPHYHFITCNISFKKSFFERNGPFDERYKQAMGEDTDLGIRFALGGMRFFFHRKAVTYHHHPIDDEANRRRLHLLGRMLVLQEESWPGLHEICLRPPLEVRFAYRCIYGVHHGLRFLIGGLPTKPRRFLKRFYFRVQEQEAVVAGFREELQRSYRRGMSRPDGACLALLPSGDPNQFYRHVEEIRDSFPGHSLVLIGQQGFQTRLFLRHPTVDWFILAAGPIGHLWPDPALRAEVEALDCRSVAVLEPGPEFSPREVIGLRRLGLKDVRVYNSRKHPLVPGFLDWWRACIALRPAPSHVVWAVLGLGKGWLGIAFHTLLVPVKLVRFFLTRLLYRSILPRSGEGSSTSSSCR